MLAQYTMESTAQQKNKIACITLCGFGRAGQIHFGNIRRNHRCHLKYIVDLNEPAVEKRIRDILDEYNVTSTTIVGMQDYEKVVLQDPEVTAVVIASPTDTHEFYARAALKSGRSVFCEKPVAGNIKDTAACYDEAAKMNTTLLCAFNRRFDPAMFNVQAQVKAGKIGQLYEIKTCSRDSPRPLNSFLKISGGMFHDCGVHDIDLVCWIAGEEPVGVFAMGSVFDEDIKDMGDVDTIAIMLKFPSGVLATINLSRHSSYGYDQRLEVFGEKGMLQVENIHDKPVCCSNKDGVHDTRMTHSFPQRYKQAYENELEHFLDTVLDPTTHPCVVRNDALLASRVATACERSAREGKMVSLDPVP